MLTSQGDKRDAIVRRQGRSAGKEDPQAIKEMLSSEGKKDRQEIKEM
jgi:hypothetical protein